MTGPVRQQLIEYVIDRAAQADVASPDTIGEARRRVRMMLGYVEWMAEFGYSQRDRAKASAVLEAVWPEVGVGLDAAAEAIRDEINRVRRAAADAITAHPCPYCGQPGLAHLGTCRFSQMNGGDTRLAALADLKGGGA